MLSSTGGPNNANSSDSEKQRAFVAAIYTAGNGERYAVMKN